MHDILDIVVVSLVSRVGAMIQMGPRGPHLLVGDPLAARRTEVLFQLWVLELVVRCVSGSVFSVCLCVMLRALRQSPRALSGSQIETYDSDGFLLGLRAMSADQARHLRCEFEAAEAVSSDECF